MTPNRKAARASASTPETARGFANLSGKKVSPSKISTSSRKRLAEAYGPAGKLSRKTPSPGKSRGTSDRLSLKRKAMATLSAARRKSPGKQTLASCKMKTSVSDGELLKHKVGVESCLIVCHES